MKPRIWPLQPARSGTNGTIRRGLETRCWRTGLGPAVLLLTHRGVDERACGALFGNADLAEWVVIDPAGVVLGGIATPRGLTIAQIGDDFLRGVVRDESDVEHAVRYLLRRL
jgi:hypothetical protein